MVLALPWSVILCLLDHSCESYVHRTNKICRVLGEDPSTSLEGRPLGALTRIVDSNHDNFISVTFSRQEQKMTLPRGGGWPISLFLILKASLFLVV